MTSLRDSAAVLESAAGTVRLTELIERSGFGRASVRRLVDYAAAIPTPKKDVVERVAPNRLPLQAGGLMLPYCSNRSLDLRDDSVKRAVVVVHGNGRNALGYYRSMLDAAGNAGKAHETLVVAPHFVVEEDVAHHGLSNDVPFWTDNGWKQGDDSLTTASHPRAARISAFAAMDLLLAKLADRNVFPNLQRFVLAGHSAGGQSVNRYAAATHERMPTTYVVANPSSYLYMDRLRRIVGTLDRFMFQEGLCLGYNHYKYGLEGLNGYMQAIGEHTLRIRYGQRRVVYLLGEQDNDPQDDDLDTSCVAQAQGSHRLERGTIYYNYLQHVYGPQVYTLHTKVTVPGVGHSAGAMFTSPEGVKELFS
jgi:pimeloyl-ACP methyl ester carboxylesterase